MRCPQCGDYRFDSEDMCLGCGYRIPPFPPPSWWGSKDFQKPSSKDTDRTKPSSSGESVDATPQLQRCPHCEQTSLFWNETFLLFECLNPACKRQVAENELEGAHALDAETMCNSELINLPLLGVKMFLAEIRSWRKEYRKSEYLCADFANEVFEAATKRGIRCGYVTVYFEGADIAHAIVCFQTDYGLKFIEPQNGEEESVTVGRLYPIVSEGVPRDSVVSMIEIKWNDGTSSVID